MKLDEFFGAMGPFLAGNAELSTTLERLGDDVPAKRLALYGRFCALHREGILERLFPLTRDVLGEARFAALSRAYFVAHPTRDWELNSNAQGFPAFLHAQRDDDETLPAWLPELAEVEWLEWTLYVAPDEPMPRSGRYAVNPTLTLRQYAHDVITFADDGADGAPAAQPVFAAFWRDARLQPARALLGGPELGVIKALSEDVPLSYAAGAMGVPLTLLTDARAALVRRGILAGPWG